MKKLLMMPLLTLTCLTSLLFSLTDRESEEKSEAVLTTQSSFIQSNNGNFEMVVRNNGRLCHYQRENDKSETEWTLVECFGENITSDPSLIQSDYGEQGNLELVVRETVEDEEKLCHYYKGKDNEADSWKKSECFGKDISSAPSLIQSDYGEEHGNFEVVVRENDQFCHYWRANNKDDQPWDKSVCYGENITSAPSLIQSDYKKEDHGNFEVVVRKGKQLCHYWRANNQEEEPWDKSTCFSGEVDSGATFIQSNYGLNHGNFEVLVKENGKFSHYWRANNHEEEPWFKSGSFGQNITSAPSFIQGNYGGENGNFEALVREDGEMVHYFRANDREGDENPWVRAEPVIQKLTPMNSMVKILEAGETFTLSDKYAHDIYDKMIIKVRGKKGTGQTVLIKDSKFINAHQVIETENVDNVIIVGNYFDNIGEAIRVRGVKNLRIEYNKVKDFGMVWKNDPRYKEEGKEYWWAKHFVQVMESPELNALNISHNLVDRSTNNCKENIKENVFAEDYININNSRMVDNRRGIISYNYLMGSVDRCESASAGAIVIDQNGKGFDIKDNVIYNTGQYLIGSASSDDISIKDNTGFITFEHEYYIRPHSDRNGTNEVAGFIISNYCDNCIGSSGKILLEGNRLLAEVSENDTPIWSYYSNWIEDTGDNPVNKDLLTFVNNNFTMDDPTNGALSNPTREEVLNMIIGENHEGMFITHGQKAKYFDESRVAR